MFRKYMLLTIFRISVYMKYTHKQNHATCVLSDVDRACQLRFD